MRCKQSTERLKSQEINTGSNIILGKYAENFALMSKINAITVIIMCNHSNDHILLYIPSHR